MNTINNNLRVGLNLKGQKLSDQFNSLHKPTKALFTPKKKAFSVQLIGKEPRLNNTKSAYFNNYKSCYLNFMEEQDAVKFIEDCKENEGIKGRIVTLEFTESSMENSPLCTAIFNNYLKSIAKDKENPTLKETAQAQEKFAKRAGKKGPQYKSIKEGIMHINVYDEDYSVEPLRVLETNTNEIATWRANAKAGVGANLSE